MWPLTDITVYCDEEKEPWTEFRFEVNYISDFYHNRLDGYKPPKTARICLQLRDKAVFEKPNYFGAICSYEITFDLNKYKAIADKLDRYKFMLDLIHKAIIEMSDILKWDKGVFIKSYNSIIRDNFQFIKEYPTKTSRDKKNFGQVTIEKTEKVTVLKLKIKNGQTLETKLLEKKNWYWFDSGYEMADKMKWIDKDNFGYKSKKGERELYFSLVDKSVRRNFEFKEGDM
jgi:hypothetical protein